MSESEKSTWCMVDINTISVALKAIECPKCQDRECLFFQSSSERFGFAVNLQLNCSACNAHFADTYTSPRVGHTGNAHDPFLVNDIMVLVFNQLGLGHSAMQSFAALFGMKGLHLKTFQKKESRIIDSQIETALCVLSDSVNAVKQMCREINPDLDEAGPFDVTVSFDGSWQKRGHTSLYGIAAVIEINTGLVLDYEVLSKYCHACSLKQDEYGPDTNEYREWFQMHQAYCDINYIGSSNAMETEAAKRIWSRSFEKYGIRYTGFLSDGDSKAYNSVVEMKPYGTNVLIERDECVNHAHKRMGTALLKLSKEKHLGGRGPGRLTAKMAEWMQRQYKKAISHNKGDPDGMREAVWACLFHCMSTDDRPLHSRCPIGEESWCFYNKAIAKGEASPSHDRPTSHTLSYDVSKEMIPIFKRVSDLNLMRRLAKGKTQNPNECFHSVVWSRCPKTVFVGAHKLSGAVAKAVSSFNAGSRGLTQIMESMAIEANEITMAYAEQMDKCRISKAEKAATDSARLSRFLKSTSMKRQRAIQYLAEGPTYGPGMDVTL